MKHLPIFICALTNFLCVFCVILHSKGPTHKKNAGDCLEEIIRKNFHFQYEKPYENHTMLLTAMVTDNMSSPAFEIQEDILRRIHDMAKSYQVEIMSFGKRFEFESFEECRRDECQKRFIIDFKSNFYVIVLNDDVDFEKMLDLIENSKTFNPKAMYLVYAEHEGPEYEETAMTILMNMWSKMLLRTGLLIPKTLQTLAFYQLNIDSRGPEECGSNVTLVEIDRCEKGSMLDIEKHYYKPDETNDLLNCTIGVITMPYEPFVINETHGFEIEVLQSIASIINVNFNVTLSDNLSLHWGTEDEYGNWSGKLKWVYKDYYVGVGNIATGLSYAIDFSFSRFYHMEPVAFVVPIARFVPKWRVIIAIFTLEMWGICGGIIICFGISFYISSKCGYEIQNFKSIGMCFYQSLQVFILHAVPTHPVNDFTRVFFVSLAVISIIMASAYTCSLVYYLKNPIREHQSSKNSDIMDNFGNYKYGIGGVAKYRELFTFSDEEEGTGLYQMYQTASDENDTMLYWINKVGNDRNIWTVASKSVVHYFLSQDSNYTTDNEGKPKVYVFKSKLMSYSLSLIMRDGHPLLPYVDYAIQKLMWAGLIDRISEKYKYANRKLDALIDYDDSYKPIQVNNLQGAFALLIVGYIVGFVTFLLEFIVEKFITERAKRKIVIKRNLKKTISK